MHRDKAAFSNFIPTVCYSALIPGLLEAYALTNERREAFLYVNVTVVTIRARIAQFGLACTSSRCMGRWFFRVG